MSDDTRVVLDACVLVNFSLCDTLLRLAESPRLFEPAWSDEILAETTRALELKLGWPNALVRRFEAELRAHFPDAWVRGYGSLVGKMTNDEKDRHVLAAAVVSGSSSIVTFNLRHFRREHLEPWNVCALHPQAFLLKLFRAEPELVLKRLVDQAADRGRDVRALLKVLQATVPEFAAAASIALEGR
ncbi:MAG TPA: PIN domain-containing protein [Bryobacteraceae bacterium]|jgi:predicted nucleic acid-binding protein|nr:PIN domain-containing protein [Bryobacteraceae bacterium]